MWAKGATCAVECKALEAARCLQLFLEQKEIELPDITHLLSYSLDQTWPATESDKASFVIISVGVSSYHQWTRDV